MTTPRRATELSTKNRGSSTTKRGSSTTKPAKKRRSPSREIPPWRPLTLFFVLLAVIYALIFFTGGGSPEPKLGIDLQGGTRVTLTARTESGNPPTREQLDQAKQIIEQRVNGLGVSGSEVVVNGNNLIITVPGQDGAQAKTLGQTARLFVRPVVEVQAATPQPKQNTAQEPTDEQPADQIRRPGQSRSSASSGRFPQVPTPTA